MHTSLYIYTTAHLTLPEALERCRAALTSANDLAYALLYDPRHCRFARLDAAGTLRDAQGQAVETATVFEAYLFNSRAELRWLHDSAGCGRVAVLSEDGALNLFGGPPRQENIIDRIAQRYLLWGEGTATALTTGWSHLAAARTGAFAVPVGRVGEHERVQLTAFEYLKEYTYGNVGVCEERLTGLIVADEERTNG